MHLFVAGPPGIGKSTVAPHLARMFGASVVEVDAAIERLAKKSCKDVIEHDGVERFRDLESRVIAELRPSPAWTVVDLGGGAVLRPANRARMRELGVIVGLRGSVARVAQGLAQTMDKRPHPNVPLARRAHFSVLSARRVAAYRDADTHVTVRRQAPIEVAREVAAWLASSRGIRIDVHGSHPYPVIVRAGILEDVGAQLAAIGWKGTVALVRDRRTDRLCGARAKRSLTRAGLRVVDVFVPEGEAAKTLRSLAHVWDALAAAHIGRDGGVVALGGGATGDVAGFAAATYLRGIRVAQVPTTLLAMVDSAIGGKTAIDLASGKNLAGAFHQPDAVVADPTVLATLPSRQVSSGLAEIVKTAFLADRASVAQLHRSIPRVRAGELGDTLALVSLAAEVKAGIVSDDERESGLRELLNYGHTFGHAYEAASGYRVTHGEAVAIGLVFATALAEKLGLAPRSLRTELEAALDASGLPIRARLQDRVWSFLEMDKKVRAGKVRWILPHGIGRFSEVTDVSAAALRTAARVVEGKAA